MDCVGILDGWLEAAGRKGGVERVQLEFCTNNFHEVQQQLKHVNYEVIPIYHDLFLEQGKSWYIYLLNVLNLSRNIGRPRFGLDALRGTLIPNNINTSRNIE